VIAVARFGLYHMNTPSRRIVYENNRAVRLDTSFFLGADWHRGTCAL
jgi:hypothetical protein